MYKLYIFIIIVSLYSCAEKIEQKSPQDEAAVHIVIDDWHNAASTTNFETYFGHMTKDAIFIGTDPTEYWHLEEFKTFCKPYFDKDKAWNFTSLQRHIYFNQDHSIAWFDELLNTQMKICRGSGVLRKEDNQWKIAHYVLSMTVPNGNTNEVVKLKTLFEQKIIDSLSN